MVYEMKFKVKFNTNVEVFFFFPCSIFRPFYIRCSTTWQSSFA